MTTPPLLAPSPVNTAATPPALLPFSPNAGPKKLVASCPYAPHPAKAAPLGRPKKPCDAKNLKLVFHETDGKEVIKFETLKAAAGVPSQRPRDTPVPTGAPAEIQSALASYDLVIEVLGIESGRSIDSHRNIDPITANRVLQMKAVDSREPGKPRPKTSLTVGSEWDSHCADPSHAHVLLDKFDGKSATTCDASFSMELASRPLGDAVGHLWDFIKSGFDPRILGQPYDFTIGSCGAPASGRPTGDLKALVTAFPEGATGVQIVTPSKDFSVGWYSSEIDAEKKRLAGKEAQIEKSIGDAEATGARWSRKSRHGAAGKKTKRVLASNHQDLARLKERLEQTRAQSQALEDESELEASLIVFDREIALTGGDGAAGQAWTTIKTIYRTLDKTESVIANLQKVLNFAEEYTPSATNPIASLSVSFFEFEFFFGTKLTSDDSQEGPRYRALSRQVDLEANIKAFEISGSLGISFGKNVLGTGANAEAVITLASALELDVEYTSPRGTWKNWKNTDISANSNWSASGHVLGQVSIVYFAVAHIGADVSGVGHIIAQATIDELLKKEIKASVVLDPLIGSVEYSFFGTPQRHSYVVWQGGEWPLTHE